MLRTTRINKPKYPPKMVDRSRLYCQLDRWQDLRAIFIHAPTGYGKSCLVSRWIDIAGHAPCSAWLTLDEGDSIPRQFAQHLATALDRVIPGCLSQVEPILDDRHGDLGRALGRLFSVIQDRDLFAESPECQHILLVLDDLHRLQSTVVEEAIMTILNQGPDDLHLILLARWRTALPLARLCAHGDVLPLDRELLKFTEQEVGDYVRKHDYIEPDEKEVAQLTVFSEGWVVALKLAILSNHGENKISDLIKNLRDKQTWLADYLVDEVLDQQGPDLQHFLLKTSILDEFNLQLCEAVSRDQAAHVRLDEIARKDLFLIQLDEAGIWFRYHHLFQELLQHRLRLIFDPSLVSELHRRAGEWLAGADLFEAAVRHYLAGEADDRALALVETQLRDGLFQEYYRAKSLLAMLPDQLLSQSPQLMLDRCRLAMLFSDERIETFVSEAERTLTDQQSRDSESSKHQAEWLVLRLASMFVQGDFSSADELIRKACEQRSYLDGFHLGTLYFLQLHLYSQSGMVIEMEQVSEAALTAFVSADFSPGVLAVRREMARWSMWAGRREEANQRFRELIEDLESCKLLYGNELAVACLFAAENSYWQDHFEEAQSYQREFQQLGAKLNDHQIMHTARYFGLMLGEDFQVTSSDVQEFLNHLENFYSPALADMAVDYMTRSLVASGKCDLAWQIVQGVGIDKQRTFLDTRAYRRFSINMYTYIARGVDLADITQLLLEAISVSKERKRRFDHLHLLALLAWQKLKLGDEPSADRTLLKAVVLAVRTGYIRVILSISDLAALLQTLNIDLFELSRDSTQIPSLVKLTDQEQRVLEMLAAGNTYLQIASEMVISINTVRTHVRNLYRKLSASWRDQAVAKAMTLGLLPVDFS